MSDETEWNVLISRTAMPLIFEGIITHSLVDQLLQDHILDLCLFHPSERDRAYSCWFLQAWNWPFPLVLFKVVWINLRYQILFSHYKKVERAKQNFPVKIQEETWAKKMYILGKGNLRIKITISFFSKYKNLHKY